MTVLLLIPAKSLRILVHCTILDDGTQLCAYITQWSTTLGLVVNIGGHLFLLPPFNCYVELICTMAIAVSS